MTSIVVVVLSGACAYSVYSFVATGNPINAAAAVFTALMALWNMLLSIPRSRP